MPEQKRSSVGLIGFAISCGSVGCGLLAIPGFVCSIVGVLQKSYTRWAWAGVVISTSVGLFLIYAAALIFPIPSWIPSALRTHLFTAGRGAALRFTLTEPQLQVHRLQSVGGGFGGGYCSASFNIRGGITNREVTISKLLSLCASNDWVPATSELKEAIGPGIVISPDGRSEVPTTNDIFLLHSSVTNVSRYTHYMIVRCPDKDGRILFFVDMQH